jgi:hypothetical protein
MRVQFHNSLKTAIGLVGAAAMGLGFSAPAALADDLPDFAYSLTGEEYEPLTSENQFYSLEAWDLVRRGFICVNNPNEECTGEVLDTIVLSSHRVPTPLYEVTEETRTGFVCVNNVNPACDEPIHYGVIYADPEPEIPLNARIAALWAELDELATRPTTLPALAPAPEPPILAPVPGLW